MGRQSLRKPAGEIMEAEQRIVALLTAFVLVIALLAGAAFVWQRSERPASVETRRPAVAAAPAPDAATPLSRLSPSAPIVKPAVNEAKTLRDGFTDSEIGSRAMAGSASYDDAAARWTVAGGGRNIDIADKNDPLHFTSKPLSGDWTLKAKITAMGDTNEWGRAGVMFRDSAAPDSTFVGLYATFRQGVSMQWRNAAGAFDWVLGPTLLSAPSESHPVWLKLVKRGTGCFAGFYSLNGIAWHLVGATVAPFKNSNYLAGMAVTSHNEGALNTARFENVEFQRTRVCRHTRAVRA